MLPPPSRPPRLRDDRVLVERRRPKEMSQLVEYSGLFASLKVMPHACFVGPPGTGKTTAMRLLAEQILRNVGVSVEDNIFELNASDDTSVNKVRDDIRQFAECRARLMNGADPTKARILIVDEFDYWSVAAMRALLTLMESFPHFRVLLAGNSLSKMVEALQSRVVVFYFHKLCVESLTSITKCVGDYPDAIWHADGDARSALKLAAMSSVGAMCLPPKTEVARLLYIMRSDVKPSLKCAAVEALLDGKPEVKFSAKCEAGCVKSCCSSHSSSCGSLTWSVGMREGKRKYCLGDLMTSLHRLLPASTPPRVMADLDRIEDSLMEGRETRAQRYAFALLFHE